jgi:hypothetical protein
MKPRFSFVVRRLLRSNLVDVLSEAHREEHSIERSRWQSRKVFLFLK